MPITSVDVNAPVAPDTELATPLIHWKNDDAPIVEEYIKGVLAATEGDELAERRAFTYVAICVGSPLVVVYT